MRNSARRTLPILIALAGFLSQPGLAQGPLARGADGPTPGGLAAWSAPALGINTRADSVPGSPGRAAPWGSPPRSGQSPRSSSVVQAPSSGGPATEIRWYHAAGGLAAVALTSLADEPLRDELQAHRTSGKDDVAAVFRRMGEPEVYGVVGLGTIAVGIIAGNDRVRRAGQRISAGLLISAVVTTALKEVVGRQRPNASSSAFSFKPFSGQTSWPSGHTTMAFALAASVSDELHSTPASVALYSGAALTGWSRLNDNKHWLSDVVMGAAVGVTGAKLMNGRWRVLGIHAPKFLLEPQAAAVNLEF
jgi:membrane-associated phospholipid phosphatase